MTLPFKNCETETVYFLPHKDFVVFCGVQFIVANMETGLASNIFPLFFFAAEYLFCVELLKKQAIRCQARQEPKSMQISGSCQNFVEKEV